MATRWKRSIGTRFTFITVLIVLGITTLLGGAEVFLYYRREVTRLNQYLFQVRESHIPALVTSLWLTDEATLLRQIEAISRFPYIDRVEVVDDEGKTFSCGTDEITGLEEHTERLVYTRRDANLEIGTLRLFIDQATLRATVLRGQALSIAGYLITVLTMALAIHVLFRYQVGAHLAHLAAHLRSDESSDLGASIVLRRRRDYPDELRVLVSALNRMRRTVQDDIAQRELLVSEIHHRIKNDMAFVKSLLQIQAAQSDSPAVQAAVREASQRVSVMTRIYERLYRDDNVQEIAVRPLVEQVIRDLQEVGHARPDTVQLTAEDFTAPTRIALALGIVLNELVTNALKYASDSAHAHRIDVNVAWRHSDGTVEMEVRDDGTGFPDDVINGERTGYGLMVAQALVGQHDGTITLLNDSGAVVCVRLPCPLPGSSKT